jgi:hypothetical protein
MRQQSMKLTISGSSLVGTSLASSFNSDPQNLFAVYAYSIQIVWSGGAVPVGAFTLQASDDPGESNIILRDNAPVNWTTIASTSQSVSATPGSILYDVPACSYRWVRLVYTATSGSANITSAQINVKGV